MVKSAIFLFVVNNRICYIYWISHYSSGNRFKTWDLGFKILTYNACTCTSGSQSRLWHPRGKLCSRTRPWNGGKVWASKQMKTEILTKIYMQTKTQIDPQLISFIGKNKKSSPLHLLSRLCNEEAYSVGGHLNMCVFHSALIAQNICTKAHIHYIAFESKSHGNTYVSRKPCFVVDWLKSLCRCHRLVSPLVRNLKTQ